jgi:hypothetical protein
MPVPLLRASPTKYGVHCVCTKIVLSNTSRNNTGLSCKGGNYMWPTLQILPTAWVFSPPFSRPSLRLWRHQAYQPPASLQLPLVATPADANGEESHWRSPIEASCVQTPACRIVGTYTEYVYGVLSSSPYDAVLSGIRTARTSESLARPACTPSPAPR